jgi:hypothetical protein
MPIDREFCRRNQTEYVSLTNLPVIGIVSVGCEHLITDNGICRIKDPKYVVLQKCVYLKDNKPAHVKKSKITSLSYVYNEESTYKPQTRE